MGFSADPLGAEPVAVVVAGCDPIGVSESAVVVGPDVNEQLATESAMQVASPAIRLERAFRERRHPSLVLSPFFAPETNMIGITALAPGWRTALMSAIRWVDVADAAAMLAHWAEDVCRTSVKRCHRLVIPTLRAVHRT
jgi:hypothetical protein